MGPRQALELSFCAQRSVSTSRIDFWSPEAPRWAIISQDRPPKSPKSSLKIQGLGADEYISYSRTSDSPLAEQRRSAPSEDSEKSQESENARPRPPGPSASQSAAHSSSFRQRPLHDLAAAPVLASARASRKESTCTSKRFFGKQIGAFGKQIGEVWERLPTPFIRGKPPNPFHPFGKGLKYPNFLADSLPFFFAVWGSASWGVSV